MAFHELRVLFFSPVVGYLFPGDNKMIEASYNNKAVKDISIFLLS